MYESEVFQVSSTEKAETLTIDEFIFHQTQNLFKQWFHHLASASPSTCSNSQTNDSEGLKTVTCLHPLYKAPFYTKNFVGMMQYAVKVV